MSVIDALPGYPRPGATYGLGLRSGDALHLAIAHNAGAEVGYSLDRKFVAAGRRLKIRARSPI